MCIKSKKFSAFTFFFFSFALFSFSNLIVPPLFAPLISSRNVLTKFIFFALSLIIFFLYFVFFTYVVLLFSIIYYYFKLNVEPVYKKIQKEISKLYSRYTFFSVADSLDRVGYKVVYKYLDMLNLSVVPHLLDVKKRDDNFTFDWLKTEVDIKKLFYMDVFVGFTVDTNMYERSKYSMYIGTPGNMCPLPRYKHYNDIYR